VNVIGFEIGGKLSRFISTMLCTVQASERNWRWRYTIVVKPSL